MVESLYVENLNYVSALVAASLANTAFVACVGVAVALVLSRHKQWSAASRYGLCWLLLVFVTAAPFVSALMLDPQEVHAAPKAVRHAAVIRSLAPLVKTAELTPVTSPEVRITSASMLLLCWAAATCFQLMVVARSFLYAVRLKRHAKPANNHLTSLFAQLCTQVAMRRPVSLAVSHLLSVPAVVGYWNPVVLIPADLEAGLTPLELEQVLLHELAHVARFDDWGIFLQRLLEAAGIWHPLVRYLGYRLSRDREMACDDQVAAVHEPRQYAACLAKVADIGPFFPVGAMVLPLLERKSELLDRVEMLLDKTRTHVPRMSAHRLCLALAGLLVLGTLGLRVPQLLAMPVPVMPQNDNTSAAKAPQAIRSIVVKPPSGESDPGRIEFKSDNKVFVIRDTGVIEQAQRIMQTGLAQHISDDLNQEKVDLDAAQVKLRDELKNDRELDSATAEKISRDMQALKAKVDSLNTSTPKSVTDAQEQLIDLQARLAEMQAELGASNDKLAELESDQASKGDLVPNEREMAEMNDLKASLAKSMAEAQANQAFIIRDSDVFGQAQKKLNELIREAQRRGLAQQVP